jgi:5-deoxy-glucuronate isomerase
LNAHDATHRHGFLAGFTPITRSDDPANETALAVGVLKLAAGTRFRTEATDETAWLLMDGSIRGTLAQKDFELRRSSLFDESASCLHACAGTTLDLMAVADCELTVYSCASPAIFAARIFTPKDVPNEHRGLGQVRNRSLRFVRTIFDGRNSPPEVRLVLGEVVTLPGGWSSYPPHHHLQPEIYHYRFTQPQGFGHAELGETVVKVRQYDTIRIPAGLDHAQCAAPGYGMYYSWVIRHLPDNPYTVPEFTADHAWTMSRDAAIWWPRDLDET